MQFLLAIAICIMCLILYNSIKKDLVYENSPADPKYIDCMVTTTFLIKDSNGFHADEYININKIFYVYNKLNTDTIIQYIEASIKNLYHIEINNMEINYKKKFGAIPKISSTQIKINFL
jgi:hypothetical protein